MKSTENLESCYNCTCLLVILLFTALGYWIFYRNKQQQSSEREKEKSSEESKKKMVATPDSRPQLPPLDAIKLTMKELAEYDGSRGDGRILVAFKSIIYDVSKGLEEFGPNGTLACVAGRSLTDYLENTIKPMETPTNFIDRWEMLLNKNYIAVGTLITENAEQESQEDEEEEKEDDKETEEDNEKTIQMCSKSVKDYMMTDNFADEQLQQPEKTLIEEIN